MSIDDTKEKRFESDIESFFISKDGGYTKGNGHYDHLYAIYPDKLIAFVKETQPKEWSRFEKMNTLKPEEKFCRVFADAVDTDGMLDVVRKGFKHRGISFRVCYFKPESSLNATDAKHYAANIVECYRQWYYSPTCKNSVDMVLVVNGIPLFAIELKNQYTGQTVENAQRQWMYDRDKTEGCFAFNRRILGFFCVDHSNVLMTTRLNGGKTFFLPFNQGSNGAGNDGGKGNPPNPDGYPTDYFWKKVFQKDSMLDILQKFMNLEVKEETDPETGKKIVKKRLVFPRYHQLHVVRKLIADVSANGAGRNYLIQHSAGSGKSNSIAWTAYRLASIHGKDDKPIFRSVVVVTDRTVLDKQLQETINGFDHTLGVVETIDDKKTSKDLLNALNDGVRLIVTTLQKFPVIYQQVESAPGQNFAVIVDEAHSSQTGSAALKLKTALADTEEALKEYAEIEGIAEEELDKDDKLLKEMVAHGKHKNLSFFAFTATPKEKTLELFGTQHEDGTFHPFHIYSMCQAIQEHFILDVLQNYMTYSTCYKIAKSTEDNPDVPASKAAKVIKKFQELHPYNIQQKSQIIVETFRDTTKSAINHRGKMMVVTSSRLAAVRYYHECKRYIELKKYDDVDILVAFSGSIKDGGVDYTESSLNKRKDGSTIKESQTKKEFRDNFNVLIVAEKYQTGFDEPLLHTMIVDKKLTGVKAVQTLSRLNRICEGKDSTFILDFVNTEEDIRKAFEPFYHETSLGGEINVDGIYKLQKDIAKYGVYTSADIEAFIKEYAKKGTQDRDAMGRMTSILTPSATRYNALNSDDRYNYRRLLRSLVRWYGYCSQILRMFDKELHKEAVFAEYLVKLIPPEPTMNLDLEGKLKLEYYKLKQTFAGSIYLSDNVAVFDASKITQNSGPKDEQKNPLDEIIERINQAYKGEFTQGDRVVANDLFDRMSKDDKLKAAAQTSDPKIFAESVFPKVFDQVATDSYMDAQDAYTGLFEDKAKYKAFMGVMAEMMYRFFRGTM